MNNGTRTSMMVKAITSKNEFERLEQLKLFEEHESSSRVGSLLGGGEPRVWVAENAIPEEIMRIVRDFVSDFQTQVPDPVMEKGTILVRTPTKGDLRVGDTVYFRRQGLFSHQTGWDRVVLTDKWPETPKHLTRHWLA